MHSVFEILVVLKKNLHLFIYGESNILLGDEAVVVTLARGSLHDLPLITSCH